MRRTILFGLDGATYTVLDDLVRRGVMPYLGEFIASGARGILRSIVPPLTPPAWTTMVTGRTPGHHGILDFFHFESPDSLNLRVSTSRRNACETIWSMASRHEMRAASLNFAVHYPAEQINGYVIPGWIPWRWVKRGTHPPELIDRFKADLAGFDVKTLAIDNKQEKKAIDGAAEEEYEDWIDLHIRRDWQWFNILRYLLANEPCELVGVVFDGVDKLQHLLWRFVDPALEPDSPTDTFLRFRERCWDYFRQLDGFLKETVELAGPEASIFIASDHGFTGTEEVFYINTWLEQRGYLAWRPETEIEDQNSQQLDQGALFDHLRNFDLERTRALVPSAGSNGIHILVRGRRGLHGIAPEEYDSFRRRLKDELLTECRHPETGQPLVEEVWLREENFAGPKMADAPDLTLTLWDHGLVSVLRGQTVVKKRPAVMGTHHPDGVFVARGPGIQPGVTVNPVRLIDLAPTILYTLGLPIPGELEGSLASDVFTEERLETHSRVEAGGDGAVAARAARRRDDEVPEAEDRQILERMKALGYIE